MSNKSFPTYNAQRKTGDRGVTFVREIIENHFDWIFRPTHLEEDFGKISFMVDGYNGDAREVYEIPEIRLWTKKVLPAFKYWGYFLNMEPYIEKRAGLKMLLACTVDIKVVTEDHQSKRKFVEFDINQTIEFVQQIFGWLNEFTEKYNIPLEVNKEQSDLIIGLILRQNTRES